MAFQPMPLSRKRAPFDHPEWIFELKYDGFRSLATIQNGRCQLISRNGNPFSSFSALQKNLAPLYEQKTVLDGEIVCLNIVNWYWTPAGPAKRYDWDVKLA
jgi:bifunctional non-homologous end joining protein LigD